MKLKQSLPLRIGVIGAGFSGAAFVAHFHRLNHQQPVEITLFDKTGFFGVGDAYRTPYPFHLLNVRARDMSAFEDEPTNFVDWLSTNQEASSYLTKDIPISDQFVPRFLYGNYLKHLLSQIRTDLSSQVKLNLQPAEVIDIIPSRHDAMLVLKDRGKIKVDKVVLALGNNPPAHFSFPISSDVNCIANPWDYSAIKQIDKHDPVLIVGTGLSMIDSVLTLYHQQHQGPIYAVSRHGLLPLPHAETGVPILMIHERLPENLRSLTRHLRLTSEYHINEGGHWQSVINALRSQLPVIWANASLHDKKRFLRHVLSYWNIHRHRVHKQLTDILSTLQDNQQLKIFAGVVAGVRKGKANIKLRGSHETAQIEIKWLLNCMGPSLRMTGSETPLVHSLIKRGVAMFDPLRLGFDISANGALNEESGDVSPLCYALGPLRKGISWECSAVPEIRKQCFDLAKYLLTRN